MSICTSCICLGYCIKRKSRLVSDREMTPHFVRDLRMYAHSLSIPYTAWRDYITDEYRDYEGWVATPSGKETSLDMEVFETDSIQYWFRDFCCTPCPDDIVPYVKDSAPERVRILATILRARNPKAALMWGIRAANDNDKDK